jgi:hypothetical protein
MFLFYLYCWRFAAASRFTLYSTIVSLLLVEVFFFVIFRPDFPARFSCLSPFFLLPEVNPVDLVSYGGRCAWRVKQTRQTVVEEMHHEILRMS